MKKKKYPKSDVRYWSAVVVKRRSRSDYCVRLQFDGHREWFNTGEAEKSKAGSKAKEIYDYLRANGWVEAVREYKKGVDPKSDDPTFGEFFDTLREYSTLEASTLEFYISKCRTLVGEIFDIDKPKSVHYAKGEERQKWIKKVEATRLSKIKPLHLQKWKKMRIDRATTPEAKQRARTTLNTILRSTKSLFSPRMQKELPGVFPNFPWTNPITECDFEKVRPPKFRSHLASNGGIALLMKAAERDLRPELPEIDHRQLRKTKEARRFARGKHQQYKILLLALGAGLRRSEIDSLRWQQLDFVSNVIRIETNELTRTKSPESEANVDVQPALMDRLRQYKSDASGDFVVEGKRANSILQSNYQYRCDRHFKNLIKWLRGRGIEDSKPLHALRKEFGSEMIRVAGVYEASSQLRHADIRTTTNYYAYKKNRATVELFPTSKEQQEIREA